MDQADKNGSSGKSMPRSRVVVRSLKAEADKKRTSAERFADWLTDYFGTVAFLGINAVWFTVWIVINLGWLPGVAPFDPFPFGLLTMVVSLEAIILAIIVLISQNRASRIDDLREEIDLQINTLAEEEVTKMIQLQILLLKQNGVDVHNDPEIKRMLLPLSSSDIEQRLEREWGPHKRQNTR
jgi:uncharacterized membrane protein